MSTIRKPHNLVTAYWDDSQYFFHQAELVEYERARYDKVYQVAISNLPPDNEIKVKIPQLPTCEKRSIRYSILSSFLFLEAFINAEYVDQMNFVKNIDQLSTLQKSNLDKMIIETSFDDKWSKWLDEISGGNKLNLKGVKEFQEIKTLKEWRNHLTHYKIHHLMFVAHELESIENAREAVRVTKQSIDWYYRITKLMIPEWIQRDVLAS